MMTKQEAINEAIEQAKKGGMFRDWHLPIWKIKEGYQVGSWRQNNSSFADPDLVGIVYSENAMYEEARY